MSMMFFLNDSAISSFLSSSGRLKGSNTSRYLEPKFIFENRIYSETDSKVVYPKSEDFGVWAWSFRDHDLAMMWFKCKINEC